MGNQLSAIKPPASNNIKTQSNKSTTSSSYFNGEFPYSENSQACQKEKKLNQSMSTQEIFIDEGQIQPSDNRKQVVDNRIQPYNGVGRIFYKLQGQNEITKPNFGTGFLITTKHVLTNAHLFHLKSGSKDFIKPKWIKFYPEPLSLNEDYLKINKGIKAKIFYMDQNYFKLDKDLQKKLHDCVVLQLEDNQGIRQEMVLKCNLEYSFDRNREFKIIIPSYADGNSIQFKNKNSQIEVTSPLHFQEMPAVKQEPAGILKYEHTTEEGTSGAPLILKKTDHSYEVIGLHVGAKKKKNSGMCMINFGLLFRQCKLKSTIASLIKPKASPQTIQQSDHPLLKELLKCYENSSKISEISDEELKVLAIHGDKFKSLQTLHLGSNQIKDAGLIKLAENGDKFKCLHTIDLWDNQITDAGLIKLVENGDKFKCLHTIDLWDNQITDAGLIKLAENGDKFKCLHTIDLWANQITDAGLIKLVENGDKFKCLHTIDLRANQITDAGLIKLAENGDKFKCLQTIDFGNNKITDAGLIKLAENGDKFKCLQTIDLGNFFFGGNKITDAGLIKLAENGDKFKSLQTIFLWDNKITQQVHDFHKVNRRKFKFHVSC